jgi:hypothetical protein
MIDQSFGYRVLCGPLIAFDVIANDHNLLPSRAVEVMKGLVALSASHHQQSKVISYAGHMGSSLRTLNKVDLIFEVGCKLLGAGRKPTINLH